MSVFIKIRIRLAFVMTKFERTMIVKRKRKIKFDKRFQSDFALKFHESNFLKPLMLKINYILDDLD